MSLKPPEKEQNYRQQAENIRAKARKTRDPDARVQLLLIASLYDKLAKHVPLAPQARRPDNLRLEDPPE